VGRHPSDDQRIFFENFAAYLTADRDAFVIDLDDVIGVLGYTRRDNARRSVESVFRLNVDYNLLLTTEEQVGKEGTRWGGHNRERIMLTVRGFKELCVMANTEHGKRMRHYYMTMTTRASGSTQTTRS
jgi:phage anti-repressor protein